MEMKTHDGAMHKHDKGGDGHKHNDLKSAHMDIMKQHKSLSERLKAESTHHNGLISGILKFAKEHSKSFHMHTGDHDHSSHDHGKNEHKGHDHDHGK